jgi:hypothetical protein
MTPAGKRWLLTLSEVMLILVILCLLALIWLPAWIGARPGS